VLVTDKYLHVPLFIVVTAGTYQIVGTHYASSVIVDKAVNANTLAYHLIGLLGIIKIN
jgi:hypothetical protein